MDIDRMSAGRDLDAQVAEIMGYYDAHQLQEDSAHDQEIARRYGWIHMGGWVRCSKPNLDLYDYNDLRYYSTDIAAAWEVVKHLSRQGIEVVVCEGFSGNLSTCMLYQGVATDYPPRDLFLHLAQIEETWLHFGDIVIRTQAETVSLAICRAALSIWAR